ncbi:hypothetical protein ACFFIX_20535 [Metabacillus herbersteinensis]|uniref:Sulfotransferase family protein n=1 Tax=Metabacillus herbersteinensis TaxID=283816 RepID=A0ABV6GJZ4_9BACI
MKKVLLGIGNKDFSQILRNNLLKQEKDFIVPEQEVMHHRYLSEIVDLEKPDILVVHDYYLPSDNVGKEEREREWLSFFSKIRVDYDDAIRIVFMCERQKGDPFLSQLVGINVLDIFNNNSIDMIELIDQLNDKPRFSRVSKFMQSSQPRQVQSQLPTEDDDDSIEKEEDQDSQVESDADSPNLKRDKQKKTVVRNVIKRNVVKNVIEKKVEKTVKVVNKQVVKRDYSIQILNQVEKIVGVPIQAKTVLIGSPFSRSGSTFVSHLLARELARLGVSVTYIESPYSSAYSYDRFIGHERIPDYRSKFYQFTKEIDPKKPSIFDWTLEDINMVVKHPSNEPIYGMKEIPFDVYVKILLSSQSTVTILDVGTDWHQEIYRDIYDIATNAYFILEPDIANIQYLEDPDNVLTKFFREVLNDSKSHLIGNRFDRSILENEFFQNLYRDDLKTIVPCFNPKHVFDCHYAGTFINDISQYQNQVTQALQPIIEDLLPNDFIKKQRKGTQFFRNMLNKKIKIESK